MQVTSSNADPDLDGETLPSKLRQQGYATGFTGKWHLSANGLSRPYEEIQQDIQSLGYEWAEAIYPDNVPANSSYSHNMEWLVAEGQVCAHLSINSKTQCCTCTQDYSYGYEQCCLRVYAVGFHSPECRSR